MYFFSALPNVVGVFGETKKIHMMKNTAFGRGEVGGPILYFQRHSNSGARSRYVSETCHVKRKMCNVVIASLTAKLKSIFTYKKIVLQNNFACVRYLDMSRFLTRKQVLIICSSFRNYFDNILGRLQKVIKNYLSSSSNISP